MERCSVAAPLGFQPTSHNALSPLGNYGFFLRPHAKPVGNKLEQEAGNLAVGNLVPSTPRHRTLTNHALSPCNHHAFHLSEHARVKPRREQAPQPHDLRGRKLRHGELAPHLRQQQERTRDVVQHRFRHHRSSTPSGPEGGAGGLRRARYLSPAHRAIHMSTPRPGSAAAPPHLPHERFDFGGVGDDARRPATARCVARARQQLSGQHQRQQGAPPPARYEPVRQLGRRRRRDRRDDTIRSLRHEIAAVRRILWLRQ